MAGNTQLGTMQPYGSVSDPFTGTTWQTFFQDVYRKLKAIISGLNSGALPTFTNSGSFTVAALPSNAKEGDYAYATNGRKVGEGAGAGTGVPVYYSTGSWRVFSTDAAVTS